MAGTGSRFANKGYELPKPFIDVCGLSMIQRVMDNLSIKNARYILIVRKEHLEPHKDIFKTLSKSYDCEIITIDKITEGAACTILLSSFLINDNTPLLLANSDQIVEMNLEQYLDDCGHRKLDGSILTFQATHPKWSYAKVDRDGLLMELKEKEVISPHATVGLYYFERGRDFVNSATVMIANNDRVNHEFYTAPAYNYGLQAGLKFGIFEIQDTQMFGLGTPEDLDLYINYFEGSEAK
jgi:UDP-N-acetylglucosamine diphosphorylase / glucose-1-phosphate thymidylyltransferase / UDP-N-acetylgalactosamine diphosphorylase / glucosamine-1-phosphate N-acetyltransferase / galactosamine-1-phosphate N-acetyltransferase